MRLLLTLPLFIFASPLLADSSAAYPPNPYEIQGGRRAPTFSDANAEAMHFINIVDNQVYGGAWLDGASLMHDVVPQEVWAAGMRFVRIRLGTVNARKVSSHQVTSTLPGGTKGSFMIIKYETQFSQQPNSMETVVLMMEEPLGLWKVVNYIVGKQ